MKVNFILQTNVFIYLKLIKILFIHTLITTPPKTKTK